MCCLFAATVVLDSSVACPGEMVTYTCTIIQGAILDWIVEPFLNGSTRIRFLLSSTPTGSSVNCNNVAAVRCEDFEFVATLTNTANPMTVMSATVADMTSTLTFTASARLNGTVVQCRGTTADGFPLINCTLNIAGAPVSQQHKFHVAYRNCFLSETLTQRSSCMTIKYC